MTKAIIKIMTYEKISLSSLLLNTAGWFSYCVFWVALMLTLQQLWN